MRKPILSKLFFGAAIISLSVFTSCKDEEKSGAATQSATQTSSSNSSGTDAQKSTAQLNPEHGLPGHRCDLPVGAPLTGASPAQTIQATDNTTPSSNVSPIRLNQTPAVNPPHGEPGHDCAVPVGAALN